MHSSRYRILDTRLWKHYLSATSFADYNKYLPFPKQQMESRQKWSLCCSVRSSGKSVVICRKNYQIVGSWEVWSDTGEFTINCWIVTSTFTEIIQGSHWTWKTLKNHSTPGKHGKIVEFWFLIKIFEKGSGLSVSASCLGTGTMFHP